MAPGLYTCGYCHRANFQSERGLQQHTYRSASCFAKLTATFASHSNYTTGSEFLACGSITEGESGLDRPLYLFKDTQETGKSMAQGLLDGPLLRDDEDDDGFPQVGNDEDMEDDAFAHDDPRDEDVTEAKVPPNEAMQANYHDYVQRALSFPPLLGGYESAIRLCHYVLY